MDGIIKNLTILLADTEESISCLRDWMGLADNVVLYGENGYKYDAIAELKERAEYFKDSIQKRKAYLISAGLPL